ncbi:hypothetical protein PPYR_03289 [Photinus pyralis]|uniref:non-specific serine/threonine protein kinase n=1 Tax=Photinus pyralis TaxID=7054 RepID=A0A1Y1LQ36_PHOPY|nr:EKC/KEOPS complex subunit TP53RK [Photinus pyralis]KAB0791489.1 hypothetical protein PPYR_03289 [Photinus pyralis]
MKDFELIKQGAEARIYKGVYLGKPTLVKQRFEKKYRHPDLDSTLTKERIKAESRAIVRCKSAGIETPALYLINLKTRSLYLEYFEHSITAKDFIKEASDELIEKVANDIGAVLAKLHGNNIIHGDLTTSNILLVNKRGTDDYTDYSQVKLVLIDFGLAHIDSSPEDKGVDLYVLERAIISIHNNPDRIFGLILKAYQNEYTSGHIEVLNKLDEVRSRGRKRLVVG